MDKHYLTLAIFQMAIIANNLYFYCVTSDSKRFILAYKSLDVS